MPFTDLQMLSTVNDFQDISLLLPFCLKVIKGDSAEYQMTLPLYRVYITISNATRHWSGKVLFIH